MLNVHRKSHTAAHFQLRRSSCNSLGSTLSLLVSRGASASGSVCGDDILQVVGWKPLFRFVRFVHKAISGSWVSSNGTYLCNNVYVISITYKCRTTRKHPRLLCLPPPLHWQMLSVLEPWPTWIWASVVRVLGTCGVNNELIYVWRSSELQLTSHLPLPNVAPVPYRE